MERVSTLRALRLRARSLRRRLRTRPAQRIAREWFEERYERDPDPWRYETSEYESEKYRRSLDALGERRFERALEIGCSIGVFTELLARRCDQLLAVDISETAVARARRRLAPHDGVSVKRRTLPDEMPDGPFDLIVASEVLYYWTRSELRRALPRLEQRLEPGGLLLAVHWRPREDTPLTGDEVHRLLRRSSKLRRVASAKEPTYRLDLFEQAA